MKKIEEISIAHFRSYSELKINKIGNILVIVGENDIGKTSILEAMDIFCQKDGGRLHYKDSDFQVLSSDNVRDEFSIEAKTSDGNGKYVACLSKRSQILSEVSIPLRYFPVSDIFDDEQSYSQIKNDIESKVRAYYTENDAYYLKQQFELLFKLIKDQKQLQALLDQLPSDLKSLLGSPDNAVSNESEIITNNSDYEDIIVQILTLYKDYDCKTEFEKLKELCPGEVFLDSFDFDSNIINPPYISNDNPNKEEIIRLSIICFFKQHLLKECFPLSAMNFLDLKRKELALGGETKFDEILSAYDNQKKVLELVDEYVGECTTEPAIVDNARKILSQFEGPANLIANDNIRIGNRGTGVKRLIYLYYNILLSRINYENRNIVFAIDEPEMSLHPSQQRELMRALKEISEYNQVILTTHSPVIVKEMGNAIDDVRILTSDGCKNLSEQDKTKRLISNYLSINEINYIAFDEPTIEYHQELYGFIQSTFNLNVGKLNNEIASLSGIRKEDYYDTDDEGNLIKNTTPKKITNNGKYQHSLKTLPHCVRNAIDHPIADNPSDSDVHRAYMNNLKFRLDSELIKEAIGDMRKYLTEKNNNN